MREEQHLRNGSGEKDVIVEAKLSNLLLRESSTAEWLSNLLETGSGSKRGRSLASQIFQEVYQHHQACRELQEYQLEAQQIAVIFRILVSFDS